MSYILEALKKSQQERELGHVPTLETSAFPAEETVEGSNPWILVAVLLAALAVIIALYSATRGGQQAPEMAATAVEADKQAPSPGPSERSHAEQLASPPAAARREGAEPAVQQQTAAPELEEPAESDAEDSRVVMEAPAVAPPPRPERVLPAVPEPAPAPVRREDGKVPDDLIADIEAFKQEVRAEQSGKSNSEKKAKKIAPKDLRLPKEVRERLPEFIMSAHIYDKEPSKRFVLINGLKTREGEESREKITVEEILPDGAVLRFEGNRFFQRR